MGKGKDRRIWKGERMRDINRIERILYKLGKLWVKEPDQRLGQLLFNYTRIGTRVAGEYGVIKDPFHYEDTEIEADLDRGLKEMEKYFAGFKAKGNKKSDKFK